MPKRSAFVAALMALSWFVYAVSMNDPAGPDPYVADTARTVAIVLSAVTAVQVTCFIVIDIFIARICGVPPTTLVSLSIRAVSGLTAAALVLSYVLNINLATLLTTSAVLTAVIGLAMQSTVAALFSGIALQLEQRIRAGDIIRTDDGYGTVENIGWRSMTVRRTNGVAVVLPNMVLASRPVPLVRPGVPIRTEVVIPGPLSVPPGGIIEILKEAVNTVPGVSREHSVVVEPVAFRAGDGMADYRVRYHSRPTVLDEEPLGGVVRTRCWYAFQRHGICLPCMVGTAAPSPTPLSYGTPDCGDLAYTRALLALSETRRMRSSPETHRQRMVANGRRLLYGPGEPILLPRDLDGAFAVVVAGEVYLREAWRDIPLWLETVGGVSDEPIAPIDVETRLTIERQLGAIIGPYARRAIERAAGTSVGAAALYRHLADLIDEPGARAHFLQFAPKDVVQYFGRSTAFFVRDPEPGNRTRQASLAALTEVELLAIPSEFATG